MIFTKEVLVFWSSFSTYDSLTHIDLTIFFENWLSYTVHISIKLSFDKF